MKSRRKVIVTITHKEIVGVHPTLADLQAIVSRIRRYDLIVAICRMNFLVTIGTTEENLQQDEAICDLVFSSLRPLLREARSKPSRRVVFNRISLLFLLKYAFLWAPDDGVTLKADLEQFGRAVLIANDLVLPRIPASTDTTLEHLHNLMIFRDYFPTDSFVKDAARAAIMINDVAEELRIHGHQSALNLPESFKANIGVSFQQFVSMIWGIYSHYLKIVGTDFNLDPELYVVKSDLFKKTSLLDTEVTRFFSAISSTESKYKTALESKQHHAGNDLKVFHEFPLLETYQGSYLCTDPRLMIEKAGRGTYWTLLASSSTEEQRVLPGFWGRVFEAYVNTQLKRDARGFSPTPSFPDHEEAVDGSLLEGRNLVLFEHKSSILTVAAKYGSDPETLKAELDSKFIVGEGKEKKGVAQLENSIKRFLNGESIGGITSDQVSRIYPVMICLDRSMSNFLMMKYINERFDMRSEAKRYQRTITPLFIITIESLEEFLPHLQSVPFHEILESYYEGERRLRLPISMSTVRRLTPKNRGADILSERLRRLGDEMTLTLFPQGLHDD